ncbi:PREDICTED: L-xylulose reductase-like [Amphimedon queenslandica]|nr:PREDICTED: L-xylulose reductase-like [Amphimedon queenslandica]|eukprot:XP_003384523.1 PREDICTED: L-xylulose reductase-like [Amphimedon queenslandica]
MAAQSFGYNFKGKKALVTGAGKGIGRATAKALVECGADVVALSRTESDLKTLKTECPGITTVCVDVADLQATREKLWSITPIDLLVNNAGVTSLQSFLEVTPEEYEKVMNVNHKAVLFLSQYVAKWMIDRGKGGAIVNVSSMASKVALKDHTSYCSSKAALDMLTKVMGVELGPHNIRVNAVNPTVVYTEMGRKAWSNPQKATPVLQRIPTGRFAEEEDVVKAILFLLSDSSSMINCETLLIDGGFCAN